MYKAWTKAVNTSKSHVPAITFLSTSHESGPDKSYLLPSFATMCSKPEASWMAGRTHGIQALKRRAAGGMQLCSPTHCPSCTSSSHLSYTQSFCEPTGSQLSSACTQYSPSSFALSLSEELIHLKGFKIKTEDLVLKERGWPLLPDIRVVSTFLPWGLPTWGTAARQNQAWRKPDFNVI